MAVVSSAEFLTRDNIKDLYVFSSYYCPFIWMIRHNGLKLSFERSWRPVRSWIRAPAVDNTVALSRSVAECNTDTGG